MPLNATGISFSVPMYLNSIATLTLLIPQSGSKFLSDPLIERSSLKSPGKHALSLTLANLGGVCESVLHSMPDMARNFYTIPVWLGHERNLMGPYFAAHRRDGIAEGQDGFWIPSSSSGLELS